MNFSIEYFLTSTPETVMCAVRIYSTMDYIALISFLLAIVAIAYFLLEFIFTGMRDRLYGFVRSLAHR